MAQAAAAAGSDGWPAWYYELLRTHNAHPHGTQRTDGRRLANRGCYSSFITSGLGRWADGNGGYGQPVATVGQRAYSQAE